MGDGISSEIAVCKFVGLTIILSVRFVLAFFDGGLSISSR
jgi:hypothetical protein